MMKDKEKYFSLNNYLLRNSIQAEASLVSGLMLLALIRDKQRFKTSFNNRNKKKKFEIYEKWVSF